MLMPSLATSSANAALPALALALNASFQTAQWIVLSYLLTVTALLMAAGRLGDMLGRRRVLLAGMITFAGGSFASGIAPGIELMVAGRIVQGAGAAIMMALTLAFVADVVPKSQSGRAMGLLGTMSAVGTTLGPAVGGMLIAWAGGRAIFLVNVPLALFACLIAFRTLPADPPRCAGAFKSFDFAGTGVLALALTTFALAMTMGDGQFGLLNLAMLTAALTSSAILMAIEARAPSPLVRLSLFRNPVLAANLAAGTTVSTVMMATLIVGPFYLTDGLQLDAAATGLVLAAGPFVAALAGVPSGRLVDQFGTGRATIAGLALIAAGAFSLSILSPASGVAGYVASIVAMTAGYGLFQTSNNTATIATSVAAERGAISGMLGLSRNLGLVAGASAMGAVFTWGSGGIIHFGTAEHTATVSGFHATFTVAVGLILATLLMLHRVSRGNGVPVDANDLL
jgi:MFS family permease